MTAGELREFYGNARCPFCGEKEYLKGPSGGMSTNIKLPNCESEINVCLEMVGQKEFPFGQVLKEPKDGVSLPPLPQSPVRGVGFLKRFVGMFART